MNKRTNVTRIKIRSHAALKFLHKPRCRDSLYSSTARSHPRNIYCNVCTWKENSQSTWKVFLKQKNHINRAGRRVLIERNGKKHEYQHKQQINRTTHKLNKHVTKHNCIQLTSILKQQRYVCSHVVLKYWQRLWTSVYVLEHLKYCSDNSTEMEEYVRNVVNWDDSTHTRSNVRMWGSRILLQDFVLCKSFTSTCTVLQM